MNRRLVLEAAIASNRERMDSLLGKYHREWHSTAPSSWGVDGSWRRLAASICLKVMRLPSSEFFI